MVLFDQPNLTGGLDETMVEVVSTINTFIPGLLLFVWFTVFLGGSSSQKLRSGYSDWPQWSLLASISTLLISLMLTLKVGLINLETIGVVVGIAIMSALWFFLSKGKGEL